MMNFTTEQMKKARAAKSAEELFTMAKAGGVPMTEDEAKRYFNALHKEGELSDTELCAVAGGTKNPQAYSVGANWAPSCDGKFSAVSVSGSPALPTVCCGKCRHYEGDYFTPNALGTCLREFD